MLTDYIGMQLTCKEDEVLAKEDEVLGHMEVKV